MPGSQTTPGRAGTRDDAPVRVAFHESDHVGARDYQAFAAQWLAYAIPCRRFANTLAGDGARLGPMRIATPWGYADEAPSMAISAPVM